MFEKFKGYFKYAAKAVAAAVSPLVIQLVNDLMIEMPGIVQAGVTALVTATLVYWVKNDYGAQVG